MSVRWNIETIRDFDGVTIMKRASGLTSAEVLVLRHEEECLPGELVSFVKTRYDVVAEATK